MVAREALVLGALSVSLLIAISKSFLLSDEDHCPSNITVDLSSFNVTNYTIIKDGVLYPPEATWLNDGKLLGCPCLVRPCLPLCCSPGYRADKNKCVSMESDTKIKFPRVYNAVSLQEDREFVVDERNFHIFTWNPCQGGQRYKLSPEEYEEDTFMLLTNGSIYQTYLDNVIDYTKYCFGAIGGDEYSVILCFGESIDDTLVDGALPPSEFGMAYPVGMIVSVPFLLATFLVYTIIPELRNMHGLTLRGYVGPLVLAYTLLAIIQIAPQSDISDTLCISFAFIIHFSFLASFFWLNVMCFDIWWTFGGFRSLQGSIKQRERKKFFIYSIYAWGSASILTGVCIAMEFNPNVPEYLIRPEFGVVSCWFHTDSAKAVYFYGPMGITVLCNICLFVSTALKIIRHKKDTAHHLKGTDSRRHDDNKQWFNLYLKLFIVMGINWSMEIVSWLCKDTPKYLWYITDLGNTLQGLIIFIIFVWKDKIKRLLLKRFGCQSHHFLSRDSTRSTHHSTTSRATCATCTTCTTSTPLQEKPHSYVEVTDTSCRRNGRPIDDSDDAA